MNGLGRTEAFVMDGTFWNYYIFVVNKLVHSLIGRKK